MKKQKEELQGVTVVWTALKQKAWVISATLGRKKLLANRQSMKLGN